MPTGHHRAGKNLAKKKDRFGGACDRTKINSAEPLEPAFSNYVALSLMRCILVLVVKLALRGSATTRATPYSNYIYNYVNGSHKITIIIYIAISVNKMVMCLTDPVKPGLFYKHLCH